MTADADRRITLETDVAKAVWLAATDDSARLRYAAGADALAAFRRHQPGDDYLSTLRETLGPK